MSYLVFLRHGSSEANAVKHIAGNTDSPLTPLGIEQARAAGMALRGIQFSYGYASGLQRAQRTLQEVLATLGQDIPVMYDTALNERSWGIYENAPYEDRESPTLQARCLREWDLAPENGESYDTVSKRSIGFITKEILPHIYAGENCIAVSHNGNLRTIQQYFENIPTVDAYKHKMANCQIKIYDIAPDGTVLRVIDPPLLGTNELQLQVDVSQRHHD